MAKIIHNLSVDGSSYALGGIHYIEGTGTTAGTWLGTDNSITEYYDGLTIAYKINIAGASATTLNINNLGAIAVRRNTSALTTHYLVNSIVILTYATISNVGYWICADYDSDTRTGSSNQINTKMFLIGATAQSTSGQTTYSNINCYIDANNQLVSNGKVTSTVGHTHTVSHTSAGTVTSTFKGTSEDHNHTFTGSAVTSGKPDTTNVTSIYSITGVGTLPSASLSSGTLPTLTASCANNCLTLTFGAGSLPSLTFNAGSLPTRSSAISMPNANHIHSVTANGTIRNTSITPAGTVTSTFKGTAANLTTSAAT